MKSVCMTFSLHLQLRLMQTELSVEEVFTKLDS